MEIRDPVLDAREGAAPRWSVGRTATVDVVVPVYNEERALPGCLQVLRSYLRDQFPFEWTITVVDNASTDGVLQVAGELAASDDRIRVLHLDRKGRGHALRTAWAYSDADVVVYLDVDLSTSLDALLPLVVPLINGHSDLAIGSRLAPGARTVRSARREVISRGYNLMIRLTHRARFSDAQCGFKAARAEVIRPLLAHVHDDGWFFDTELLLLAVLPSRHRQGIGRLLLDDFMHRARGSGVGRVHLEVRDGNPAVEMYREAGFAPVGKRSNYYHGANGKRFDALTLSQEL